MKIAYFDCFSGIAGDMALGALLDCGVPLEALREGLSSLPVSGWHIEAQSVLQNGIHAMDVRITLDGLTDEDELHQARHYHEHHEHIQHSALSTQHSHGRSMAEIRAIIESSKLSERVKQTSLDVFGRIAQAEAHLHHSTPDEIHFHEIGGVDSLIDICGVAWCLEYLNVDEVHCSALPHSTGFVDCAHGRMPVPAPATLEILKGAPWVPTGIEGELVTPTGAGIVAALSQSFGSMPAMSPQRVGLGAGKKQLPDRPNLLRVIIGEPVTRQQSTALPETRLEGLEWSTLSVIEANLDDMNPEFYEVAFERLFAAGALDVWLQPAQMKKNRPGVLLGALCETNAQDAIIKTILSETTTLGVRVHEVRRAALPREMQTVQTEFGAVRVKVARWTQGGVLRASPEYSDVRRLAAEHNVAAHAVYQAAVAGAERTGIVQQVSSSRKSG